MENELKNVEIIKCAHGVVFAACVEGYEDKTWDENKRKYLKAGCTMEIVKSDDFMFGVCDCNKAKPEVESV